MEIFELWIVRHQHVRGLHGLLHNGMESSVRAPRTAAASASRAEHNKLERSTSSTMSVESQVLPCRGIVRDASRITQADMVVRISSNEAQACVARHDALMSATGLPTSSPLPTTQSSAFFNTPGTPCAYSGLAITTASHTNSIRRKLAT